MKNLFLQNGISVTDSQLKKFEKYYELLVFYNEKFNITTITEKEDVYIKHFIDSALGVDKLSGNMLIDIGSGGGFPAIPLKILKEDLCVTLLEATGKKCNFLQTVVDELELKNVQVINNRAETLAKDENFREKFDICTARAVARLNTLSEYCLPFVKVGGKFLAYKANATEEIEESKNALKILGGKLNNVYSYQLGDANRTLVLIDKIKHTEKKYPRGNGKERKNPL